MKLHRVLWKIHRWAGLVTGLFFAIVALTGIILIWSHELNLREHPLLPEGSTTEVSPKLPNAIADFITANPGSRLGTIIIPAETTKPRAWHVYLRPAGASASITGEFDPSRAVLLGTHNANTTRQRLLVKLHYEFLLGTPGAIACWIVSCALVLLSISGLWIYRGAWRDLFRWKAGKTIRSLIGWLHRWFGVWTLVLALIWGVTGFIYLYLIIPNRLYPKYTSSAHVDPQPTDPTVIRQIHDLPTMFETVQEVLPDAAIIGIRITSSKNGTLKVVVRTLHRERWFWEKIGKVTLDGRTGEILQLNQPGTGTARQRMLVVLASLHFGSRGSRLQQIIWTIGGLAMFFLPISGYALWLWRRRKPKRLRTKRAAISESKSAIVSLST